MLRCPRSGQRLAWGGRELVDWLNHQREEGALPCHAAALQIDLAVPLEGVLVREDGAFGYVVQNGVPVLLPDHAMTLPA